MLTWRGISLAKNRFSNREKPADQSFKNMQKLQLYMRLPWNKYINPIQTHFCFPIRFKKRIHTAQSIDVNMIPVKLYFFAH